MIDIGRANWSYFRRTKQQYMANSIRLLHLEVPLVLFIEQQFIDFVRFHRRSKEHITHIIATNLKQLEYYELYDRIKDVMKIVQKSYSNSSFLNHPEMFSPEYIILMASKISLLYQAAKINVFQSHFHYWIDFGLMRFKQFLKFQDSCLPPPKFTRDPKASNRIVFVTNNLNNSTLHSTEDLIRMRNISFVSGGFFGGSAFALQKYHTLYRRVFENWLNMNLTDDDQTIAIASYFEQPELFYMATIRKTCPLCHIFV